MKWKVVIAGPTGAAQAGSAFELLYAFPSKKDPTNKLILLSIYFHRVTIRRQGY
jgi:hypothetical protein